jgi:uncharacterized membrane protein
MNDFSNTLSTDAGYRRLAPGSAQRWGAVIGGAALAVYGIQRRSAVGFALVACGGTIALLAGTQKKANEKPAARASLLVNCSREEAFRFWRDFQNLPRFMNRLESVRILDDRRSRWTVIGPAGKQISWDAEITDERENEFLEWQSLPGSDVQVSGRVQFQDAPADRGVMISVNMEFSSVPGISDSLTKFFKKGAGFAIRQDLRRMEALLEAGEIPTIEGQSHGPRDAVTGFMRMIDPTRPLRPRSDWKQAFASRRRTA